MNLRIYIDMKFYLRDLFYNLIFYLSILRREYYIHNYQESLQFDSIYIYISYIKTYISIS